MKRIAIGLAASLGACAPEVEFRATGLDKKIPKVVLDQEFAAGLIGKTTLTYRPLFGQVDERLTLLEKPPLSLTLRQLERPVVNESYLQGHDGDFTEQEFDISAAGKLDLLLVIDNSGSMGEEQRELSANLTSLTRHMSNVDWQIGIITTDLCRLQNSAAASQPIRKGDANAAANFETTVRSLGTGGSRDEQGIKMALMHLKGVCPGAQNTWLRSDASLALLFVSDEENECDAGCADANGVRWGPDELVAQLQTMRPAEQLKAYALLWNRDTNNKSSRNPSCRRDGGVEAYGSRYSVVVDALRGTEHSICLDDNANTPDYEPLLEQISRDVSRTVRREFDLKAIPIDGSMVTLVDGVETRDVLLAGKKLKLNNASENNIKLKVAYRHDASPKFDRVTLKDLPAPGTLETRIEGTVVDGQRLVLDETKRELTFLDPPRDRQTVKVRYRTNLQLPRTFDLGRLKDTRAVTGVTLAGKPLTGWEIDPKTRRLTLPTTPVDGAEIGVTYLPDDYRVTRYPASSQQTLDKVLGITVRDGQTDEPVEVAFEDGELVFAEDDVIQGREVVVTYDYGNETSVLGHELAHDPLPGSVKVETPDEEATCIDDVATEGRQVTFRCDGSELGTVAISYRYVAERYSSFTVGQTLPKDVFIQVFVDGLATHDFSWDGVTFKLPEKLLSFYSRVRIIATLEDGGP